MKTYSDRYEAAKTFVEIGQEIGTSPRRTQQIYHRAISKIRRNNSPEKLREWGQTIRLIRQLRNGEPI